MRIHSYISSAQTVLKVFDGSVPFAAWLKNYFKQHKKFGSKDRRYVAHLCYCYFRLGNAFKDIDTEERIMIGLYLCAESGSDLLAAVNEEWNATASLSVEEKLAKLSATATITDIFPFNYFLSKEIEIAAFNTSFLKQPFVYLRLRPGKEKKVMEALQNAAVPFEQLTPRCIALENSSKADAVIELDAEAVVQDINSQNVINPLLQFQWPAIIKVWDCCAASGGKSLLLADSFNNIDLTVSDVRKSILQNLQKRFFKAGIKNYRWLVADAAKEAPATKEKFDLIICDAPCSGSGTWSRTPEQLHFFKASKIDDYASLQKSIVSNVYKSLKPGGYLLYITCSVFAKENEEVVEYLQNRLLLKLIDATYYKGYNTKADTLFAALFTLASAEDEE